MTAPPRSAIEVPIACPAHVKLWEAINDLVDARSLADRCPIVSRIEAALRDLVNDAVAIHQHKRHVERAEHAHYREERDREDREAAEFPSSLASGFDETAEEAGS